MQDNFQLPEENEQSTGDYVFNLSFWLQYPTNIEENKKYKK